MATQLGSHYFFGTGTRTGTRQPLLELELVLELELGLELGSHYILELELELELGSHYWNYPLYLNNPQHVCLPPIDRDTNCADVCRRQLSRGTTITTTADTTATGDGASGGTRRSRFRR
jgi:hypothetical protein